MEKGKVISFHSYKGGTGKTTCITNLAALYAKLGKKVLLIDFDLYAPSLAVYFNVEPKHYIHDLLLQEAGLHDVAMDFTKKLRLDGELHVAFASTSKEDIHKIELTDEKKLIQSLRHFMSVKRQLFEKEGYDYVFLDTSPGIRFWSLNALAATDILFLMLKINNMDINGTKKMISEIYESLSRFGLRKYLILNKVPSPVQAENYDPLLFKDVSAEIEKILELPVFLSIPCFCDIQFNRDECLWALNKPDHPFSKKMAELPGLLGELS